MSGGAFWLDTIKHQPRQLVGLAISDGRQD